MTGAVEIVAATTDDAERWCGVVNAVGPHDRRSPARYRHMRTVVDPRGIHLLALADGREVGAASAFCPPWIGGDDLIVGGVWVLPEARGQGTGSTLLARVEAAASARGGLRFGAGVHEHDEPGRRFAERHGYAVEEVIRRVSLQLADAPLRQPAWPDGVRLTTLADEPGLLH